MVDLKIVNTVLDQLEEERGIPREKILDAIEQSLATAYKKEYGKRGQVINATFDLASGKTEFSQVMKVVDESRVRMEDEDEDETEEAGASDADGDEEGEKDERVRFNPEQHIMLEDAKKIKRDAELDDELTFPLETRDDFGRIAAQTAKQVIIQKIREAEKGSILEEYGGRQGEIVSGTIQRVERGNVYIDLGRATAIMPYDEQIPGERFRPGERIRAYLYSVDESPRGVFLRVSRSHPRFLEKLFELETPEIASGTVEIKAIAREPGSRTKVAVISNDEHIDPVGSLVGQRGVRVSTVMSELGGEKIDVIEWSDEPKEFIEDALSPAQVVNVEVHEDERRAGVEVTEDQQSLAIGKGGQNVRLAAKLTGWKIDIRSLEGEQVAEADEEGATVAPEADPAVTQETVVADNATETPAEAEETSDDETADLPEQTDDTPSEETTDGEETATEETEEETPEEAPTDLSAQAGGDAEPVAVADEAEEEAK